MRLRTRAAAFIGLLTLSASGAMSGAGIASAHTATDVVAVPAGSTATVTLRPTHGCAGSPTITVAVRAPMAGAVAEAVEGWVESSTPDGEDFTVLEWAGGVLPADETGAFPVEFLVPDAVGELLLFPAVQGCEDGSELAWISGDPATEYPAPRLLVLAAGSDPAATIDDVPLDAPGRDQLTAVVDIDNPGGTTVPAAPIESTAPVDPAPPTTEPVTAPSTEPVTSEAATTPSTDVATSDVVTNEATPTDTSPDQSDDDGSSSTPWIIGGILVLVAIGAGAVIVARRRSAPSD